MDEPYISVSEDFSLRVVLPADSSLPSRQSVLLAAAGPTSWLDLRFIALRRRRPRRSGLYQLRATALLVLHFAAQRPHSLRQSGRVATALRIDTEEVVPP